MKYLQNPSYHSFSFLEDETIKMVIRHHWAATVFIWIRWFFLGPVFVAGSVLVISFFFPHLLFTPLFYLLGYFIILYLIFLSFGTYLRWMNSVFDVIIVTNERVISIVQVDFFHKSATEARLAHIQDATGSVKGVLNTLFNWGVLTIMTASSSANIVMEEVEHPSEKARSIFILANEKKKKKTEEPSPSHHAFFHPIRTQVEQIMNKA